jgi:DNA repair ATPase RecN
MKIFEYIKKLDENGNYRLADKLDNEMRKVYAQVAAAAPVAPNYADFVLKQMVLKQMSQPKQKETDTLSPAKNTDINTLRKQVNKIISDGNITSKKIKTIENDLGALPAIEGKAGKASEQVDELGTKITDNTNDIADNTFDIEMLQESVDTLKE